MSDRMDEVPVRRMEQPEGKRRTMMLSEGDRVYGEGSSVRPMETPIPKPRRKRGGAGEADDGEGRRRRKPKATVEVNSTFTELRRLLQEMRPSTLQTDKSIVSSQGNRNVLVHQVLRTPYYRNCKAARNMRKGVRQIRDFCKQVRLETVMLAKKKQGEELTKRRRKPETSPVPEGVPAKTLDLEVPSPSHSLEEPSHSNEKKVVPVVLREPREPSESSEAAKPRLIVPKPESSPAQREREREITPKREREREITPKREKEREREKSPRREREREVVVRERERSPKREREREREREKSPKKEREKSPKPVQMKPKIEEEEELTKDDTEESE
ncbi:hypothetical protein AXG93_2396s1450 [Marchantia polymorpha subsp. ruderalis]|uniref:Uncharacterized protein n=1 Tax=Marchantia polymorpha subsp. ruderalis TaxID=1480154 RepID=A0A176VEH3_MARPO|nr:hypothetical protein AXG93_2396s1450 [Marchantia polymorpha subsp. ruderalis]